MGKYMKKIFLVFFLLAIATTVFGIDFNKEIAVMIGHVPSFAERNSTTAARNFWTPYSNRGERNVVDNIYTFNYSRNTIINEFKTFLNWFRNSEEMSGGGRLYANDDELYDVVMYFLNQKSNNLITQDQIERPVFRIVSTDNSYRILAYSYKDQSGANRCIAVVMYNL
jgi:hypothetical protein